MSLRVRLILVLLAVYLLGGFFLIRLALKEVTPRYLESMEESLVDASSILATLVEQSMDHGVLEPRPLGEIMTGAGDRELHAVIYGFQKNSLGLTVYLTDVAGRIVYHSKGPDRVGMDFSRWNDVRRTLDGAYGARTTRTDPDDPDSVVLYVAAPIRWQDDVVGVLTVGKPASSVAALVATARQKIIWGAVLGGVLLLVGLLLVASWVVTPLEQLTAYARSVRDGRNPPRPGLPGRTLGDLGKSFDEMREALEGRQYVARTLQTLTHAIKTPLTAIRGSAELLREPMSGEDRDVFLGHILGGTERIRDTVDRMLPLADLEARRGLKKMERVDLVVLVETLSEERSDDCELRSIEVNLRLSPVSPVRGDPVLLREALGNLLSNSLEFSPPGAVIEVRLKADSETAIFEILDQGPGVPEYALDRVFDRFFSLPRPDGGDRSSGLGLTLVAEIAQLHGGSVVLANRSEGGAVARLMLPLKPSS